jgi:hypothetical protein
VVRRTQPSGFSAQNGGITPMTDDDFLRQILADPGDDTLRQGYAECRQRKYSA